jgi:hypothetical protein
MEWAKTHGATRSEAIRRLVEFGLTVKWRKKQPGRAPAARAKELAGRAIDELGDPKAPRDERAQRIHQLIKGPEEFRKVRVDRPIKGSRK